MKWETVAPADASVSFFGRVVTNGLCAYTELKNGALTIEDVFTLHKMLDSKDISRLRAIEDAKKIQPRQFRR